MSDEIVVGVESDAASARAAAWAEARGAELGVPVRPVHVDDGDVVRQLVDAAEGAALLVIGDERPGRHWGDHGRHIVAAAPCPVAVVPDIDLSDRRGVVVGVDASEVTDRAVAFAADEAARRGEPLIAVAAWLPVALAPEGALSGVGFVDPTPLDLQEPTEAAVERALEPVRARHPQLAIETRVTVGDPAQVLIAAGEDAALLVVGTHGRGALARLFLGSVSNAVLTRPSTVSIAVR